MTLDEMLEIAENLAVRSQTALRLEMKPSEYAAVSSAYSQLALARMAYSERIAKEERINARRR